MKKANVKILCVSSVLAALYVALELLAMYSGILTFGDNYQIPISCFPLILASVTLGPIWGTAVGIVGSFLSQMLSPYGIGWSSVIWMIPTILYSLAVALLFLAFKKNCKRVVLSVQFIISSLLLSFLNIAANYSFNILADFSNVLLKLFLPVKIVFAVVFAIVFAIVTPPVIKKLKPFIEQ
ncbi:MAG: ECF transporter S component [Clostridia bacterium]|nr:ECF transporter S component [Clostridia bacterium]